MKEEKEKYDEIDDENHVDDEDFFIPTERGKKDVDCLLI